MDNVMKFDKSRLDKQMRFVHELDKLKKVLRVNLLSDASRRENSAEHSWHFAMMVWVLSDYCDGDKLDILKTLKMTLLHDVVEIDAGDTYALDPNIQDGKDIAETAAAERIFSLLPSDQAQEMWDLWREFEGGASIESRYARSIDRLNPFMQNFLAGGMSWIENDIHVDQINKRMHEVKVNTPKLWPMVKQLIDEACEKGWVKS
jgi:putative hydrolase of HD superfamily